MGDRANVLVKGHGDDPGVYLYTHWSGTELPENARVALARKERWDDSAYLARIVFCQMVGADTEGTTGYGISATIGDGDDRILILDPNTQKVTVNGESMSFEAFVNLSDPTWESLRRGVTPTTVDTSDPILDEQRRALFAMFSRVFGNTEDGPRSVFTRTILGRADATSWSTTSPDAITADQASRLLEALDAIEQTQRA